MNAKHCLLLLALSLVSASCQLPTDGTRQWHALCWGVNSCQPGDRDCTRFSCFSQGPSALGRELERRAFPPDCKVHSVSEIGQLDVPQGYGPAALPYSEGKRLVLHLMELAYSAHLRANGIPWWRTVCEVNDSVEGAASSAVSLTRGTSSPRVDWQPSNGALIEVENRLRENEQRRKNEHQRLVDEELKRIPQ